MVRILFVQGAEIKHVIRGYTPLKKVVIFSQMDVAKLLLNTGCVAKASEAAHFTALHEAASSW
jgi:hypothetical protein